MLSVAPLGLIGVVAALLCCRTARSALSRSSVFWRLIGMITKNAVILVSQIEAEREQGKDVRQAAIDASTSRFRPIMLTAVSTVLGLDPDRSHRILGPDGLCHHGRAVGRDRPDADLPPDALCHMV